MPPAVLEHKIEDSRTDFLITLDLAALYPQMEAMLGKTRLKKLIVGSLAEMTSAPDAVTAQMKAAKQLSEVAWDDRACQLRQVARQRRRVTSVYPIADPRETIAVLQYTGGTTGLPKGAMLTHAQPDRRRASSTWETDRRYAAGAGRRAGALARHAAAIPHLRAYGERAIWHSRRVGDHSARALRSPRRRWRTSRTRR